MRKLNPKYAEGPGALVIGLVGLEGDVGMAHLQVTHQCGERVLVVEVVVRRAVDPGDEVKLELGYCIVADQPVNHAFQVCAETTVGDIPHTETGIIFDLRGGVADGRADPIGVLLVGLAVAVELQRRHPEPEVEALRTDEADEVRDRFTVRRLGSGRVGKAREVKMPVTRRRPLPLVIEHEGLEAESLRREHVLAQ